MDLSSDTVPAEVNPLTALCALEGQVPALCARKGQVTALRALVGQVSAIRSLVAQVSALRVRVAQVHDLRTTLANLTADLATANTTAVTPVRITLLGVKLQLPWPPEEAGGPGQPGVPQPLRRSIQGDGQLGFSRPGLPLRTGMRLQLAWGSGRLL